MNMSVSSVYYTIDKVVTRIDETLLLQFPYQYQQKLEKASEGFSRNGRSPLRGCCGALDGLAIKIQEPSRSDVANSSSYFNRKGFLAINMQALCNSSYCFQHVSVVTPGLSHYSMALAMSGLGRLLGMQSDGLTPGYWIAADDAYASTNQVLTPWPGRNITESKDCFNFWLSSARIHIEQAFGMLVGRWGVLWRPLRLRVAKAAQVSLVCCKLHNFIVENSGTGNTPRLIQGDRIGGTGRVYLQDGCDTSVELHRRRRDL